MESDQSQSKSGASRRVTVIASVFVAVWVIGAIVVSIWGPALNLFFNIGMTVLSVVVGALVLTIEKLLRLGIILGRGNAVAGVGLVLALVGFAFEVAQVLSL